MVVVVALVVATTIIPSSQPPYAGCRPPASRAVERATREAGGT